MIHLLLSTAGLKAQGGSRARNGAHETISDGSELSEGLARVLFKAGRGICQTCIALRPSVLLRFAL
jgi:hypothetical protein